MNPGGFFLYIEGGDLCAERVTIHGPAEKRSSANSNTLRDAQKRQKTPFPALSVKFKNESLRPSRRRLQSRP